MKFKVGDKVITNTGVKGEVTHVLERTDKYPESYAVLLEQEFCVDFAPLDGNSKIQRGKRFLFGESTLTLLEDNSELKAKQSAALELSISHWKRMVNGEGDD